MTKSFFYTALLLGSFLFSLPHVSGQSKSNLNSIYVELGGNSLFTSVNYERQLLKSIPLLFHAGTGIYGVNPSYLTIPFGIRYLIKLHNAHSFLDLGFGATYSKADVALYAIVDHKDPYLQTDYWNYIPGVAYRRLTRKNLMYRFSVSPVLNHNDFFPFLGFSIGKSFR